MPGRSVGGMMVITVCRAILSLVNTHNWAFADYSCIAISKHSIILRLSPLQLNACSHARTSVFKQNPAADAKNSPLPVAGRGDAARHGHRRSPAILLRSVTMLLFLLMLLLLLMLLMLLMLLTPDAPDAPDAPYSC